ncbi:MAG: 30S ribosomal protein S9 [Candidatus Paceibacterota bacterium]
MATDVTQLDSKYYESVGRRKSATARVRLYETNKKEEILINNTPLEEYFPTESLRNIIKKPLEVAPVETDFIVSIYVSGSGLSAQAQAARHGIARALVKFNEEARPSLKKLGFLKRDPREKERKKPGLRKARRAPQWSKR